MKAEVEYVTRDQARQEIADLLKSVGMSRRELEAKGEAWELDADQRGVLTDIKGLEFLLGIRK